MTNMLPPKPFIDATRSEKLVFQIIRDAKGLEGWYCLHSLGLARHLRKSYAECDFVLIGPSGVYCLEVKGGRVSRHNGEWKIGSGEKSYISKEGPFKQAQSARWALVKELEYGLGKDACSKIIVGWGVMFPDIAWNIKDPECEADFIYDASSQNIDFHSWLNGLSNANKKAEARGGRNYKHNLYPAEVKQIVDYLRGDFDLVPTMTSLLAESQRELVALSSEQYRVLDFVFNDSNPRMFCKGAAGTGKTLIALEAARRLSQKGKRVLLLCYNRVLASYLRKEIEDGNVTVSSLHRLLYQLIRDTGLTEKISDAKVSSEELYKQVYAQVAEEAILELLNAGELEKYDALIIDEGQDILYSPVIDVLSELLEGGYPSGCWLILSDPDFQAGVYQGLDEAVVKYFNKLNPVAIDLKDNFRNPKKVVREVCTIMGMDMPICKREIDEKVEYLEYKTKQEQGKKLRALLLDLIRNGAPASSISILSACRTEDSCVATYPPDIGKEILHIKDNLEAENEEESFTASTISSFKGLENDIIILTDLPEPRDNDNWGQSILYVAMTRAKTKLYAMVTPCFLDWRTELAS